MKKKREAAGTAVSRNKHKVRMTIIYKTLITI